STVTGASADSGRAPTGSIGGPPTTSTIRRSPEGTVPSAARAELAPPPAAAAGPSRSSGPGTLHSSDAGPTHPASAAPTGPAPAGPAPSAAAADGPSTSMSAETRRVAPTPSPGPADSAVAGPADGPSTPAAGGSVALARPGSRRFSSRRFGRPRPSGPVVLRSLAGPRRIVEGAETVATPGTLAAAVASSDGMPGLPTVIRPGSHISARPVPGMTQVPGRTVSAMPAIRRSFGVEAPAGSSAATPSASRPVASG